MLHFIKLAGAGLALVGTALQAYQSLRQLKEVDPEGHRAFFAVDDLKSEIPALRHPIAWARRRSQVRGLLKESPTEARLYYRVRSQLLAWLLLLFAVALATVVTSLEQ